MILKGRTDISALASRIGLAVVMSVLAQSQASAARVEVATFGPGLVIGGRVISMNVIAGSGISSTHGAQIGFLATIGLPPALPLLGDINGDGRVDVNDLLNVISHWGPCPPLPLACPADIAPIGPPRGDGAVNVNDLLLVISHWG